mgnify:FL=1
MVDAEEIVKLIEELISVKLEATEVCTRCLGCGSYLSIDRTLAVAPEGTWEEKKSRGQYTEIELADLEPEIVKYGTKIEHEVLYLRYRYQKPVYNPLSKNTVTEVSYKAELVLAAAYIIKKLYNRLHVYVNIEEVAPLIVRPNKLGENKDYEIIVAPRIA